MSYEKTTWQDGDIITAEKLNNIENGVKEISENTSIYIADVNVGMDSEEIWINTTQTFQNLLTQYNNGKIILFRSVLNNHGYAIINFTFYTSEYLDYDTGENLQCFFCEQNFGTSKNPRWYMLQVTSKNQWSVTAS